MKKTEFDDKESMVEVISKMLHDAAAAAAAAAATAATAATANADVFNEL